MPLYICFAPDYPDALEKRLTARAAHQAMGAESGKKGNRVFGRGFLSSEYSHTDAAAPPSFPADQANPGMAGSCMLYRFPTIDQAWARIRGDPYWTEGVWDKDKVVIRELMEGPNDEELKVI